MIKYVKSESTVRPEAIDTESSKTTVYLRRNIKEVARTDELAGDDVTFYEYEEAKLTKEEYRQYINVIEAENIRKMMADLAYLALCTGVDLED